MEEKWVLLDKTKTDLNMNLEMTNYNNDREGDEILNVQMKGNSVIKEKAKMKKSNS